MSAQFKRFAKEVPHDWYAIVKAKDGYAELMMSKYEQQVGRVHVQIVFDQGVKRADAIKAGRAVMQAIEEYLP